jgi:hypothetical protein
MANFPLRTGYAPNRWQQGIEVMLLKQKNNYHVNKLRAILLFEADFNHNNKRLGRTMMHGAEKNSWLAKEQYGSRKQVSAIDHCLNKRLSFDIIRQFKHPAALCVNDMKGCYDRIVHSVASICMQRFGIDIKPLRSMFYTLQHLEHYIRTAQGISNQSFNAADVHPIAIQGIGQGNGAGPQIWAAISTVVLNMLRSKNAGATFESPISRKELQLAGYAYVDDTDIITHLKDGDDNVVEHMQRSLDLWAGGLASTGGQLEAAKTFWYNIHFQWNNGMWRYSTQDERPAQLTMQQSDGSRIMLEQVDVQEGRRTLGVRLAPDGNNQTEFLYLRDQCNEWADRIRSGMLPKKYTWQAFTTTILAKLAYALPATTFSMKECEGITRRLIFTTLSKAGVNAHMPRDLVYGSTERQGLGYPELYVWQGAAAVSRLVSFGTGSSSIPQELLQISYELLCLESGLLNPFENNYALFGKLVTNCYLKSTWEFASTYNITIKGPNNPAQSNRENDTLIMEYMCTQFDEHDLRWFNICRVYLQVLWISDISTADGAYIDWYATKGRKNLTRNTPWRWPKQGEPPSHAWHIWQKGLLKMGTTLRKGKIRLHQPIGRWKMITKCEWLLDSSSYRLKNTKTRQIYIQKRGRATRAAQLIFQQWNGRDDSFQGDKIVSVILRSCNNDVVIESISEVSSATERQYHSFKAFTQHRREWAWWSSNVVGDETDVRDVMHEIAAGNGLAVSDGSFKDHHGTASTVVKGWEGGRRIETSVITPGTKDDQCAYRSEAAGILATIQLVNAMAEYTGITSGQCIMGCDGKSALAQCFWKGSRAPTEIPHFDIIAAVRTEILNSPIKWTQLYIPGHQEEPMDQPALLNTEMDTKCKQHWQDTTTEQQCWFQCEWSVWIQRQKVVSNLTKSIRTHCSITRAEKYWAKKDNQALQDIDWEGVKRTSTTTPRHRQQWMTKHVSGFCSVGKMALRTGLRSSDICPRCDEIETAEHVWKCAEQEASQLWEEKMDELRDTLRRANTPHMMINAIIEGLQGWHNGVDHTFNTTTTAGIAGDLQNRMGWKHFFEGRPHNTMLSYNILQQEGIPVDDGSER